MVHFLGLIFAAFVLVWVLEDMLKS